MKNRARKLLVLGVDAALPDLLRKFTSEGSLPNIARLMEKGSFSRVIPTFPPLTAAAWAAIVTGAGPGTAGIPSLMVKLPGEELDHWHTSFDRRLQLAETLWDVGRRNGRSAALVNWPVTWPMDRSFADVQVAGSVNPPFRFFYMPLWDLASSSLFATRLKACNQVPGRMVVVSPKPASGWSGSVASKSPPLEMEVAVPPVKLEGPTYHALILDPDGKGYDRMLLCRRKDPGTAIATLREGVQSDWIYESFGTPQGQRRGRFRFQLVRLGRDAAEVQLYASAINTAEDYTNPPSLTAELEKACGPFMEVDDPWAYMDGWIDLDTYVGQLLAHADWWGKATRHLLDNQKPDMVFSWVGTIDHVQHVLYGGIVPECRVYDPARYQLCLRSILEAYKQVDRNIGHILEAVDLEETLVLLVSDHGFTHLDWNPFIKQHLAACGLLSYSLDQGTGEMTIDWSRTKCHPLEPCHAHIFINMKGRDPHGVVDPKDYRKVQQEIIDALFRLKNPETGESVVAVAIPKETANTLGVFEGGGYERVGDVLFALKPGYMANPFVYRTAVRYKDGTERFIPNLELFEPAVLTGNFTGCHLTLPAIPEMHSTMILCGPGVRRGVRRIPADITDIAPTVAHLLGLPSPKDAEGGILHDVPEQQA